MLKWDRHDEGRTAMIGPTGTGAPAGLLDLRPGRGVERTAVSADDAVVEGRLSRRSMRSRVSTIRARRSLVFDSDGTTAAGVFVPIPAAARHPRPLSFSRA